MSETLTEASPDSDVDADDAGHDHPSDWVYVKIALILAAITGIEVATYFESAIPFFQNNSVVIASLLFMMVVKFYLVCTWFMHLRFDNPIFGKMFVAGLVLAVAVYSIALSAFEFWG